MINKFKHIVLVVLMLVTPLVKAQTDNEASHSLKIFIPEVALLSIQSSSSTNIVFKAKAEPVVGKAVLFNETNNSIWINYSSIIGSKSEPFRVVTVQISNGEVLKGLNLYAKASKDADKGDGKVGNPVGEKKVLTHNPVVLINYIGSSYTGVGVNRGHNIEYSLEVTNEKDLYSKLNSNNIEPLTITYTLSDN